MLCCLSAAGIAIVCGSNEYSLAICSCSAAVTVGSCTTE
jgi:hypothetical protein